MSQQPKPHPETFHFRNLHPQIFMGTASDRYAGWIRQIYSRERYEGKITKQSAGFLALILTALSKHENELKRHASE